MEKVNLFLNSFLDKYWWLILFCLLAPSIFSLLVPGYYGASDDLHIAWLFEMDKVLKFGQFPPRFVPDLSFGFGYPLFNFVFPLPFYVGEIFHLIGLNFVDSIKATFGLSMIASGFAMYYLLREFLSKVLSITAAVIYVYAPYRAVDLYIRGAIGEIVSFVFLPLIILSILKITSEKKEFNYKWIGIGGLSIGGLVLSHNITAYMFMPFAFLLLMLRLFEYKFPIRQILGAVLFLILGLLISSYFWIPAIIESSLMKYDTVFNFVDHFPTLIQLIKPYWGYGASVAGPYDGMSFFLGITNIVVFVLGIILFFFFYKKIKIENKITFFWALGSFLIAIFLMNYRSSFIWSNLPFFPFFQFPWRFLIITTFMFPIFLIPFSNLKFSNLVGVLFIISTIAISFHYFSPQDFLGRMDGYYINKYIPTPLPSEEYKLTQEEYLRLPKATKERPKDLATVFDTGYGYFQDVPEKTKYFNALNYQLGVKSEKFFVLYYDKYNFPGWYAQIDGIQVPVESGNTYGQVAVTVPEGEHIVHIFFKETSFKLLLDIISLLFFITSLCLIFLSSKLKKSVI